MKTVIAFLVVALLGGCAATYEEPGQIVVLPVSVDHGQEVPALLKKVKRILVGDGYQLQTVDDSAGVVSTSYVVRRLSSDYADCGMTMGLDYLDDNRTKTEVAYQVLVDEQALSVRSVIRGEYKPGAVDQNITLSCVSRGILERELLNRMLGG